MQNRRLHRATHPNSPSLDAPYRVWTTSGAAIPELDPLDDLNAGVFLTDLTAEAMPVESFYTRSNFEVPFVDSEAWRLTIGGLIRAPAALAMSDVRSFGERTDPVVMECAGNGRVLMDPVPSGAPWGLGAVSVAEFTGTPLASVLRSVQPEERVVEFVFTGLDRGVADDTEINYAFSLAASAALSDGPMLVWAMNGRPLTAEHGAPLRLLVPGQYGMASVKWLSSITAVDRPFTGHFRMKYRYFGGPVAGEGDLVAAMRVRALISSPVDGADVGDTVEVRGVAWSGDGAIESVSVRVDDGEWQSARVEPAAGRFAPSAWSIEASLRPGPHRIQARAADSAGNTQPLESIWNRNGYGNNVVHTIEVTAER